MDKNVLLISSGSKFMVDAIRNNLTQEGFTIISCGPNIKELNENQENADVFLFYLGSFIEDIPEVLVYLKDLCLEKEKSLCAIGDEKEFDTLSKSVPEAQLALRMARPIDIKKLSAELERVFSKSEELQRRKNILLVDDDSSFLKIMHDWLSTSYHVVIVSSGMQAITYLANNTPDLILLDYEMPVTSGPQVLEMIRSELKTADVPVIFLTGKNDRESVTKVLALKPNGYMLKTMPKEEILASVNKFFEEEKQRKLKEML